MRGGASGGVEGEGDLRVFGFFDDVELVGDGIDFELGQREVETEVVDEVGFEEGGANGVGDGGEH